MAGLNIRKAGQLERGVMLALTGERGSGKTTTAATFPKALVLAVEDGTQSLAELETPVVDWAPEKGQKSKDYLLGLLREVAKSEFRTLIIDSGTALLAKMTHDIVKHEKPHAQSLMAACGGYGKGRDVLVNEVEQLVEALLWLAKEKKIHVVWVMHMKIGSVSMPDRDDYDRVECAGQKDAIASILNPCDIVALVEQSMSTISKGEKTLVEGDGSRQLLVGPHPAMTIKSRWHRELTTIPVEFGVNPLPTILRG